MTGERRASKTAKGKAPHPLDSHTAVLTDANKVLVFGGYVGAQKSAKLYEYDPETNTWKEIQQKGEEAPQPRSGHSAVFYSGSMYVFGGAGDDSERRQDLWQFDAATEMWAEIKNKEDVNWPKPRSGHSAVIFLDSMYIFGGSLGLTQETNDLFGLNLKSLTWSIVNAGGKVLDAEEKLKAIKKPEKRASPEASPRSKALRSETMRKSTDAQSPRSPLRKSPDVSPTISSPKQKMGKKAAEMAETYEKKREEITTPIVIAMTNSVVMKATFTNKRKTGGYEVEENIVNCRVLGNFPCGRDGYTLQVCNGKIYVFGGDRFQMAYNDLYSYSIAP